MALGRQTFTRAAVVLSAITSLTAISLTAASEAAAQGAPTAPMEVGVVELTLQDVPRAVTLPGRAVAFQEVELRPRVGGVVEEILYSPGQPLKVGDPLFRIDDAAYVAAQASAMADLATARANLPVAQSAYDRAEKLSGRGYTEAEVDEARANLAEAKATLEAAQAALDYAETELSWTTITSPISGRADVSTVSVGDLVTVGQSDALTTIVRSNPIYVDMMETSARILSFRKELRDGSVTGNDNMQATLQLENGDTYRAAGSLVTPGNTVSTTTGTVTVRFQFDNPHHVVIPGMFLRGEIVLGTMRAFLVPQRAATRTNSGKLTAFVVDADGTAKQITLTDQGSYQNAWIVREGLAEGDKLIVDGLSTLRPGQDVTPVAVLIDKTGNTQDIATSDTED